MNGFILVSVIFFALLFGGIALWAGINMVRDSNKPAPRPRPRPRSKSHSIDPWQIDRLPRGQRAAQ